MLSSDCSLVEPSHDDASAAAPRIGAGVAADADAEAALRPRHLRRDGLHGPPRGGVHGVALPQDDRDLGARRAEPRKARIARQGDRRRRRAAFGRGRERRRRRRRDGRRREGRREFRGHAVPHEGAARRRGLRPPRDPLRRHHGRDGAPQGVGGALRRARQVDGRVRRPQLRLRQRAVRPRVLIGQRRLPPPPRRPRAVARALREPVLLGRRVRRQHLHGPGALRLRGRTLRRRRAAARRRNLGQVPAQRRLRAGRDRHGVVPRVGLARRRLGDAVHHGGRAPASGEYLRETFGG